MFFSVALATSLLATLTGAAPTLDSLRPRTVTQLSAGQISELAPFGQFARAAYCSTDKLKDWSCGEACEANANFQPTLVGGDGNKIQIYFVGYWPERDQIVLGYEGTDPTQFESLLTDIDYAPSAADSELFPGLTKDAKVHKGFQDALKDASTEIFAEIQNLMEEHNTKKITVTGHSLGGAISQLSALSLTLRIPDAEVEVVTFGAPRVGNPAFASAVDAALPNYKRVNNKRDLIPIMPGRGLGFAHPSGEIHLLGDGKAVACSGQDSTEGDCQISTVPNIFVGNIFDHLGPYEEISMGTIFCT